ncbi:hypothetical protein M404DRAFT_992653, partial [Pisolithus tinctorius Marx 270]
MKDLIDDQSRTMPCSELLDALGYLRVRGAVWITRSKFRSGCSDVSLLTKRKAYSV